MKDISLFNWEINVSISNTIRDTYENWANVLQP